MKRGRPRKKEYEFYTTIRVPRSVRDILELEKSQNGYDNVGEIVKEVVEEIFVKSGIRHQRIHRRTTMKGRK